MSFDLAVLAPPPDGQLTAYEAQRMFQRCTRPGPHDVGDLDLRIVAFYTDLQARYPDHPPIDPTPWMSTPLDTGIDHVIMNITYSARGDAAVEAVLELAHRHGLVVFDPQSADAYPPGLAS